MEILKGKNETGHEVNQYANSYGNPVVRDLNKIADMNKAYRKAAKNLDFTKWEDLDGTIFSTYAELLDYQMGKFMKRYPCNFARGYKDDLVSIVVKGEKSYMTWNEEKLRQLWNNYNDKYRLVYYMDRQILINDGYDFDQEVSMELRHSALEFALDKFATRIKELTEQDKQNEQDQEEEECVGVKMANEARSEMNNPQD